MNRAPISAVTYCLLIGISGTSASAEKRHSVTTAGVPVSAPGNELDLDLSKVPLTSFKWRRKGGFLLANFKIQNLNAFSVANIVVRCTYAFQTFSSYYAGSKERKLTQAVDAAATLALKNVNMGAIRPEFTTTRCQVVDYELG